MHYIGLALYAEGPTDHAFLRPLLLRLCADICLLNANAPVEFSEDVLALKHPASANNETRAQKILQAAKLARGAWRIMFIHSDGAGDAVNARATQIQPAIELLHLERELEGGECVAVIPVREMEAWALADGNALRAVFGTVLDDARLGLPSLNLIESVPDPKDSLRYAFDATNPTRARRRKGHAPLLNALGETVSLECLRKLNGFRELESELKHAFIQLNVLR